MTTFREQFTDAADACALAQAIVDDLLRKLPSFIRRVCSTFCPCVGRAANSFGVSPLRLVCGRFVL
jgi:hypothetical protein